MTVSLTNTSRRCQVFVLAHERYCKALGSCGCDRQPRLKGQRLARSITIPSGQTRSNLPSAILQLPEVMRAARRGEVAVKRQSLGGAQ